MSEASQFSLPLPPLSPSALLPSKTPLNQAKTIMNNYLKIFTLILTSKQFRHLWNFSCSVNPLSYFFSCSLCLTYMQLFKVQIQCFAFGTKFGTINIYFKAGVVLSNRKYSNYLRVIYNSTVSGKNSKHE